MEYPKRKPTRLRNYDYSAPGAYFITICTKDKKPVLSSIVGEGLCALPKNILSPAGQRAEESIQYISHKFPSVKIDKYVIMPNHIHLLIVLDDTGGHGSPPLQNVIGQFKSYTTKQFGDILWQRSYHDHIIRNKQDYQKIWKYIDTNVIRWEKDCFYNYERA